MIGFADYLLSNSVCLKTYECVPLSVWYTHIVCIHCTVQVLRHSEKFPIMEQERIQV